MIPLTLEEACMLPNEPDANLVALDEALFALSEFDLRKSQVVDLRYFGGLSVEETAAVLNLSPDTVLRDWQFAKAWLLRHLRRGNDQRDSKAKVAGFEI
jgi:DNA-directed RNA polymerase specialized sigma24 family protein